MPAHRDLRDRPGAAEHRLSVPPDNDNRGKLHREEQSTPPAAPWNPADAPNQHRQRRRGGLRAGPQEAAAECPRAWLRQVQGTESRYYRAIGSAELLMDKAAELGQIYGRGFSNKACPGIFPGIFSDEALEWFDRALEWQLSMDDPDLLLASRLGRASALREAAKLEQAQRALQELLQAIAEEGGETPDSVRLEHARLLLARGEFQPAIDALESLMEALRTGRSQRRLVEAGSTLVETYLSSGKTDAAREALGSLPERVRNEGPLLDLQARIAWQDGQIELAPSHKQAARERLDERWTVQQEQRYRDWQEASDGEAFGMDP